jgi:hypothetical protein
MLLSPPDASRILALDSKDGRREDSFLTATPGYNAAQPKISARILAFKASNGWNTVT